MFKFCDSCERAPAAFLCKADSSSLCAACDSHIHSANPLARRHLRVPIPYAGIADYDDEDEPESWLLMNPVKNFDDEQSMCRPPLFDSEVDEYLDLEDYNDGICNNLPQQRHGGDSVVPFQYQKAKDEEESCFQLPGYGYPASISETVSISSTDMGVVPESGTPIQVGSSIDREARVLRYKEKKKNRKFEKTIRYASRKAYAERRPRIKGRFAKTRDAQLEVDHIFSSVSLMGDTLYGVVPSF